MLPTLRSWWQDRLLRGIVKNSSYLFSSSTASMALATVQGVLAARLLGDYQYGVLAGMVMPFVTGVNRLLSFRMSEVVVRYLGQYLADGQKERAGALVKGLALAEAATSVLTYLLLLAVTPLAARYYIKDLASAPLFTIYGLVLLSNIVYETSLGVIQTTQQFKHLAVINLSQNVIIVTFMLVTLVYDLGIMGIMLAYLFGKTFAGLAVAGVAVRQMGRAAGAGWWKAPLSLLPPKRELARFAWSTNLNGTVNLLMRDSESGLVGFLRTPEEAGYYRLAMSLINLVMLPIDPFIAPTYAQINESISRGLFAQTRRLLKRVSLIAGVWTVGAGAVLAAFGWWLVPAIYSQEMAPAYPALVILLAGFGLANILHWNRPLLLALGQPAYPLKVGAVVGVVKTVLTFTLVPFLGYLAEAAIQSAYLVSTVWLNVARGMGELTRRAARETAVLEAAAPKPSELGEA